MKRALIGLSLVMLSTTALPLVMALAEEQLAAEDGLQEVIVTANKRQENPQNVGTSLVTFSAAQIKDLNLVTTTDIANSTPGLQVISPNVNTDTFYSIRGASQNDFSEHQESPVAVYIDGVYQSQAAGIGGLLFDTDRVEVLRGPQGTLFGRNATGGLVQYITKEPTDTLDGYSEVTVGDYGTLRYEGAIGDQIFDGLSFRLSLATEHNDPWLTNTLGHGDNPEDNNAHALRGQLRYKSNDDLDILVSLHGADDKQHSGFYRGIPTYSNPDDYGLSTAIPSNLNPWGTCDGCDGDGYRNTITDFYTGASSLVGWNYTSTLGVTTTAKYKIGDVNITSITDYTKFNKNYQEDSTDTPQPIFNYFTAVSAKQLSEELRLDNGSTDRLRWVGGFYFLDVDGGYREGGWMGVTFFTPVPLAVTESYVIDTKSWAPFIQGEYDILDDLVGTLGFRWSQENKTFYYDENIQSGASQFGPVLFNVLTLSPAANGDEAQLEKGDWSGRAALNWHVTDDVMAYVSWNRGIKAGGFSAPMLFAANPIDEYKFGEERLYAYETGVKSEFLDHHARVNADVFYYDYVNYQAYNLIAFDSYIFNAPAKVTGGELQLDYTPLQGLELSSGTAILNAQANNVPMPNGTLLTRKMAQTPRYNETGQISYSWEPAFGGLFRVATDFSWRSSFYYDIGNSPVALQPAYWLQNLHAGYDSPDGHWGLTGYVENLFEKHYYTNIIPGGSTSESQGVIGQPRMFGFRLAYHI